MKTITVEIHDTIAIVKINRPKAFNSMNEQMSIDARQALADIRQNNTIRAMILTGEGRSFCAGAELNDELSGGDAQHSAGSRLNATMRDHTNPWIHDLHNMPIPIVVAINGVAAGAGAGLALAGDISIAANSAAFVLTFSAKLGLIPDVGLTWQLSRRIGMARATAIALLGDKISAEQAVEWGLIWQSVDDDKLMEVAMSTANRLAKMPRHAALELRQALHHAQTMPLEAQLDYERKRQCVLIEKPEFKEGVAAFKEKRTPDFR